MIPQPQYYVRAYATNNIGTSYGTILNFTTPEGNYFSFSSPYAGEEYTVGETHNISWSSNYSDRRVIIEHWYDGNYTELTNNEIMKIQGTKKLGKWYKLEPIEQGFTKIESVQI